METIRETLWKMPSTHAMQIRSVDVSTGLVLATICTKELKQMIIPVLRLG